MKSRLFLFNELINEIQVTFNTLTRGDFFATRVVLEEPPNELKCSKEQVNAYKAKLSIIADATMVEIYTIDRKHLASIPENLYVIIVILSTLTFLIENFTKWNTRV